MELQTSQKTVSPFLPLPREKEAKEFVVQFDGFEGRVGHPLPSIRVPGLPAVEVLWRDLVTVGVNYLHHLGSGSDEGECPKVTRHASSLQQFVWTEHCERRADGSPRMSA